MPKYFHIAETDRKAVVRFLRRLLRKSLGSPPRLRLRRSMALDSTLYRVFHYNGQMYVAIASLTHGKRLIIPLRGQGALHGNIRVVWNPMRGTACVHMPYDVRQPNLSPVASPLALDAGVTEVLTKAGPRLWETAGTIDGGNDPNRQGARFAFGRPKSGSKSSC